MRQIEIMCYSGDIPAKDASPKSNREKPSHKLKLKDSL